MLRDQPRVTVTQAMRSTAPGSSPHVWRHWEVALDGRVFEREGDLGGVDDALMKIGDCIDCGRFGVNATYRPRRCERCKWFHEDLAAGYRRAAEAARNVDRVWADCYQVRSASSLRAAVESRLTTQAPA